MRRRAFGLKEILYTGDGEQARWQKTMPTAMMAPIPFLEPNNPEKLFDDMIAFALRQPTRGTADQYRTLFAWLCERYEKVAWIERSGATLRYFDEQRRTFPDAKYVHIHRDGVSAALSMREHNWFILAAHFDEQLPTMDELKRAILEPSNSDDDPITRFYTKDKPPLEQFARMWARQIARGFREFVHLDRDQYLAVNSRTCNPNPSASCAVSANSSSCPTIRAGKSARPRCSILRWGNGRTLYRRTNTSACVPRCCRDRFCSAVKILRSWSTAIA
ncbi:MAG: sulfotransferase [Steroidobacteraceae bacterium]